MSQTIFPPGFPSTTAAVPHRQVAPPEVTPPDLDSAPSLERIVQIANEQGHSDVHLGVGETPRYRARGEMLQTEWPVTTFETFQGWLQEILSPQQIDDFLQSKEFDGAYAFPFVRVRINLLDSLRGPAMVLRLIPQTILSLEALQLPDVLRDLASRPKGLVLVTGPTGSGKSTTLAAMIDWINRQREHATSSRSRIPVEFVHESRKFPHPAPGSGSAHPQIPQRPPGRVAGRPRCDSGGRNPGSGNPFNTALEAAQTGHLVFGTLHTNSAVKTVERVLGMYPPEEQESMCAVRLSESLLGVIAQGLIKHNRWQTSRVSRHPDQHRRLQGLHPAGGAR